MPSKPHINTLGAGVTSVVALRRTINTLIERVNYLSNLNIRGGVATTRGSKGMTVTLPDLPVADHAMRIAEVQQAADTGGGYYDCILQKYDASDWDTVDDGFDDLDAIELVVLNVGEQGGATWTLAAGDLILCWHFIDDEGNARLMGVPASATAALTTTAITVLTDFQVDGANSEIETKNRENVLVLGTDAESGWAVDHTGTVCP